MEMITTYIFAANWINSSSHIFFLFAEVTLSDDSDFMIDDSEALTNSNYDNENCAYEVPKIGPCGAVYSDTTCMW